MSTKKLQIVTPIVTSVNGQTGDVTLDISGGGTGTSVQSDWNQNDETASDYIKNKPFYQEAGYEDITWDGNTDGKTVFDNTHYLVSTSVLDQSYFIGATITIISRSTSDTKVLESTSTILSSISSSKSTDDVWIFLDKDGHEFPYVLYVLKDNVTFNSLTIEKKGLYFYYANNTDGTCVYISNISAGGQYNKKLESRYLPMASALTAGAIKVGNGLSISDDGTLSVTTATYYTGTADPVNTLGADGDLYLQTEG